MNKNSIPLPIGFPVQLFIEGKITMEECCKLIINIIKFGIRMEINI